MEKKVYQKLSKKQKLIIAGNWKMHTTIAQAEQISLQLLETLPQVDNIEVVLCPPFTALSTVSKIIKNSCFKLGAQDVFWQMWGAYTGEISPLQLCDCGCEYVIIGHSERRNWCNETDSQIKKKLKAVSQTPLIPILCVGESLGERERGACEAVVSRQLSVLENLNLKNLVVAYEPVWAIGTGIHATPQQIQQMHQFIRDNLQKYVDDPQRVPIQYGGSVNKHNCLEIFSLSEVDGMLVGGASLEPETFAYIVKQCQAVL